VGSGNTEVYVGEGATTLAVFTLNTSGTATAWLFNLVWEGRSVGRQPNTGARSYYHFDILGGTRSVTQGTTVVESYDYEPWGLLMPGRTLGSGTKEGFTGKEQDTETGLSYFGARYYLPAIGRWAAVDPLTDKYPEWASYNYVLGNPVLQTDPDGRQVGILETILISAGIGGLVALYEQWVDHEVNGAPFDNETQMAVAKGGFVSGLAFGAVGETMQLSVSAGRIAQGVRTDVAGEIADQVLAGKSILGGNVGTAGAPNFVYRNLASGENVVGGITARAPGAGNSPISHVAGQKSSQWISTTKSQGTAFGFGKKGSGGIVRIDLNKVASEIVDLSNGIPGKPGMISNWAKSKQEVLVRGQIPPEAFTRIW
jgi:RHS repeat-associated protein